MKTKKKIKKKSEWDSEDELKNKIKLLVAPKREEKELMSLKRILKFNKSSLKNISQNGNKLDDLNVQVSKFNESYHLKNKSGIQKNSFDLSEKEPEIENFNNSFGIIDFIYFIASF